MLGAVIAAVMAASFFMPWFSIFGEALSPANVLGDEINLADLPWRGWVLIFSFVFAGLGALAALVRMRAGPLMLIAGLIPYALIAETFVNVRGQIVDLGLPLPQGGNPFETIYNMRDFVEMGLPAYFIAALILIGVGATRTVRGR